jgi:putative transposase
MSRPLRLDFEDAIHHVTARGNAREPVYRDEIDRALWKETLAHTVERFGWIVLAYCQMGNHFHLLLETPRPNLSRGMRQLNGLYAQRFNRRHGRVGHLFQARFHASLVERGEHLLALAAYVPLNPVRAGLCAQPVQWRWSSYRATLGLEPPAFVAIDRLLDLFGETREEARERYRSYVEDGVEDQTRLESRIFLGSEQFVAECTRDLERLAEVPRRHWQPYRPPLPEILRNSEDAHIVAAYSQWGYTMREIAEQLGVHYATVSRRIRRHEAAMLECKT